MKVTKFIQKRWFEILLIISLLIVCFSCTGSKKTIESNSSTNKTEKKEVSTDSVSQTNTNKAINDKLTIPVNKVNTKDEEFNAKCTDIIDELLSKINTQKQSGGNNYKLYYDLERRLLELQVQIAETKDVNVATNSSEKTEKSFEQKTDEYVSKKVKSIPWWFWVGIIIWFLPQILTRVALITNPLTALINNKNK